MAEHSPLPAHGGHTPLTEGRFTGRHHAPVWRERDVTIEVHGTSRRDPCEWLTIETDVILLYHVTRALCQVDSIIVAISPSKGRVRYQILRDARRSGSL
jgi:hypothetical protein